LFLRLSHLFFCSPFLFFQCSLILSPFVANLKYKELAEKERCGKEGGRDKMLPGRDEHYIPAEDPTGGKKGKKQKKCQRNVIDHHTLLVDMCRISLSFHFRTRMPQA
jgi:hypothetical protein